jgi:hypothetical protein
VWGDDIELEAFRRAYKKPIVIYDASTGTPYVKPYDGDEGTSLNTVHLWKSECHYESVRNKDGPFDGPSKVIYKVLSLLNHAKSFSILFLCFIEMAVC